MNLKKQHIEEIAKIIAVEPAALYAFIAVESGGQGFDPITGKITIQFEPTWFSKYLTQFKIAHTFTRTTDEKGNREYVIKAGGITLQNGVEGQKSEWEAFNAAWKIHPKATMLSTSIGLMQVMGFNYSTMGYGSVDAMWDDFKKGEYQQVLGAAKFIKNKPILYKALKAKVWSQVAYHYNGENYKVNRYDTKLANAYARYSKIK